jgi:hypothetical protein
MQLWQLDIMGSVLLTDGTEVKLISGVDDHSRFCVIAAVVRRATGRAVCAAFAAALAEYGVPEQVLTDNGRQFTGRFGRPRPTEVLFDRLCRHNGVEHLLTAVRSPTTTGKVERWHQTIQDELLEDHGPFADLATAQAAVDEWRIEYNHSRPHQSLGMASPADRFRPVPPDQRAVLPLWLPADLAAVQEPTEELDRSALAPAPEKTARPDTAPAGIDAVELDRVVPPSGNLAVRGQQFWFGPARAGLPVRLWIDTTTVHLSLDGRHFKTLPSRLNTVDLARLRAEGATSAGPPPARPSPGLLASGVAVEVDRTVNASGVVHLAGAQLCIGQQLAGRRVTLRIDRHLLHVIAGGVLWRTVPFTLPDQHRARIQGARLAGPPPPTADGPTRVQRRVSARGGTQVIGQRVQVGFPHAGKVVTIEVEDSVLRVLDEHDQVLTVVPRTSHKEVKRHKAYGRRQHAQA